MITKKVIDEVLSKCLSHAQIRSKLKGMSVQDRLRQLEEENKLTPLESQNYSTIIEEYINKIRNIEQEMEDEIEEYREIYFDEDEDEEDTFKIPKRILKPYEESIKELENELNDALFNYDRRLFENYEISKGDNPIPMVDWDKYVHDYDGKESYDVGDDGIVDIFSVKLHASRESIGEIEDAQIRNQSENIKYTPKELEWLRQFFTDGRLPSFLTYMINGREPKKYIDVEAVGDYINEDEREYVEYSLTDRWKNDFNNIKNHLDNAIDKSEGLEEATILYHAGRPDPKLLPGDHGTWNGYKSMSFQEQVMSKHRNINDDYWNIIVLAPKGTKGVCANDLRFRGFSYVDEHEYLLGRNTGYTVVDMDYDNHTQIVILDD